MAWEEEYPGIYVDCKYDEDFDPGSYGSWKPYWGIKYNRLSALFTCPKCEQTFSLVSQTVSENGRVSPSTWCPYCRYHKYLRLTDYNKYAVKKFGYKGEKAGRKFLGGLRKSVLQGICLSEGVPYTTRMTNKQLIELLLSEYDRGVRVGLKKRKEAAAVRKKARSKRMKDLNAKRKKAKEAQL